MALSNRDRVGRGFELLAAGLAPFVDAAMSAAAGSGGDWVALLSARENAKQGAAKAYSLGDPAFLLKVLTEEWRVFKDSLSRAEQSFASELRDVRNRWAHNEPFNADDTYRALDTMERLLLACGAPEQADAVRRIRVEHQLQAREAETRKAAKALATAAAVEGLGLKPWREVIAPHPDVASGNFSASEFAADLHMVAQGEGGEEYVDPVQFFRRTYLTEGLRDLLVRAARRVAGDDNASPIVNLQTNFGGGKTHSMLALYHLFSGTPATALPQEVQELLAAAPALPARVRRVSLVGTHLAPGKPSVKPDGTQVRTLWGELAWQLGGREAYDLIAESDASATSPGEALRTLLDRYAPAVVLIDEWVAYARQLYGRDDLPAGTFDTQFTFAQTLTEVAKSVSGVLLVISIPASDSPDSGGDDAGSGLEVGGANGREALKRLQNVVRRVADQWRPASANESFEIVRRRLFEEPTGEARAEINAIARRFSEFYLTHRGEFPREAGEPAYEARMRAAYPLHPELFDRLYEDWSTLERFQRTRGVLRLMSTVVHRLWAGGDAAPMILPGSVPLDDPAVASELTQYLEDAWKPILDADIDGDGSTPVRIDGSRSAFGQRALTRRIARSIFVGSAATLRSAHKGVERQRIYLGVAVPGDTVGNFGSSLSLLTDQATYLYVDGARYWYDTQASVTRTAKDYAERLHIEDVWAEIVRRLRETEGRSRGDFAGVHVAPDTSADVPDTDEARLVVLGPSAPHVKNDEDSAAYRFARACLDTRGSSQRTNRNMVVFLAPDAKRLEELVEAAREHLAWSDICARIVELNLSPQQEAMARSRLKGSTDAVTLRIAETWHWCLVPVQPVADRPVEWEVVKADGASERLAERASARLKNAGLLSVVHAARLVRADLDQRLAAVWSRGHLAVGDLWSYYCRYPYLARLRDRSVLNEGVLGVEHEILLESEGFALATGFDEATGRYTGLVLPGRPFGQVTDATLIVQPAVAQRQIEQEVIPTPDVDVPPGPGPAVDVPPEPVPQPAANTRFYGVKRLDPQMYGKDWTKVSQEVLQHLAGVEGVAVSITVEIAAERGEGFPADKVRIVLENAKTLKFDSFGFDQ